MRYEQIKAELRSRPRTWLVTGAAGFIGSHLAETLLSLGQNVRGFDNFATGKKENLEDVRKQAGAEAVRRFEFIEGDICSYAACRDACKEVDYVLHQAALGSVPRSIEQPIASHQANVDGFVNMALAAREEQVKAFVYASSSSVYGDSPDLPKREERIGNPLSPYAATKLINEIYASVFSSSYGLRMAGLRYFNVFGPRQDPEGAYAAVIPRWIGSLFRGERCVINGDGETSRDFCYVANVVQANILAAAAGAGGVYNVALGGKTSLNELYAAIKDLVARLKAVPAPEPEYRGFRAGDVRHSLADTGRIKATLGYEPTHNLEQGLELTVGWYAARNAV